MVAGTDTEVALLSPDQAGDPRAYARLADLLCSQGISDDDRTLSPIQARKQVRVLAETCLHATGRAMGDAAMEEISPLERIRKQMKADSILIGELRAGFRQVARARKRAERKLRRPVKPAPPPATAVDEEIRWKRLGDGKKYVRMLVTAINAMMNGVVNADNTANKVELIVTQCELALGLPLTEVVREQLSVLRAYRGLTKHPESELRRLQAAYRRLEGPTPRELARWDALVGAVIRLQAKARLDAALGMVYALRDQNESRSGQVLKLEWFHTVLFEVWGDPKKRSNLCMMHPGTGKTTCSRWQKLHELGHCPQLRCLLIYGTKDQAEQEMIAIKNIMAGPDSGEYYALFPGIRILGKTEGQKNSSLQFTVARKNWQAREPTIEAGGVGCNFQGQGYGRVWLDDPTPEEAREQPYIRNRVKRVYYRVVKRRLREPKLARISIVCTPWAPDDLAGEIRKQHGQGRLPTWRVEADAFAIRNVDPNDPSSDPIPLWPEVVGVQELREARFEDESAYQCCYELRAGSSRSRPVKRLYYWNAAGNLKNDWDREVEKSIAAGEWWLSIDPAGTDAASSSDHGTVEVVLARGEDDRRIGIFTDVWFHHKTAPEMFDWLVARILERAGQERPYTGIMIEAQGGIKGMVTTWEEFLRRQLNEAKMPEEQQPIILAPGTRIGHVKQNRSKYGRLIEASPYLNSGVVLFPGCRYKPIEIAKIEGRESSISCPEGTPMATLRDLILNFDGTTRFDAGDAVSQWVLVMRDRLTSPFKVYEERRKVAVKKARSRMATAFTKQVNAEIERLEKPQESPDEQEDIAAELDFLQEKHGVRRSA